MHGSKSYCMHNCKYSYRSLTVDGRFASGVTGGDVPDAVPLSSAALSRVRLLRRVEVDDISLVVWY